MKNRFEKSAKSLSLHDSTSVINLSKRPTMFVAAVFDQPDALCYPAS